jgi:hypothetical protein
MQVARNFPDSTVDVEALPARIRISANEKAKRSAPQRNIAERNGELDSEKEETAGCPGGTLVEPFPTTRPAGRPATHFAGDSGGLSLDTQLARARFRLTARHPLHRRLFR